MTISYEVLLATFEACTTYFKMSSRARHETRDPVKVAEEWL